MPFGFKTKKDRERELEQEQQRLQLARLLAGQERARQDQEKVRQDREKERIARELHEARLKDELNKKDAEIRKQRQRLDTQVRIAREEEAKAREQVLAQERETQRLQSLRELRNKRLKSTEPENLRTLRDNVRRKYQLDIAIWADRGVRRPDRPLVEKKMEEADALLDEILQIVNTWEKSDNVFTDAEWELAEEIKKRLLVDGKRRWAGNPPWGEN
jgi:hypothetical protein